VDDKEPKNIDGIINNEANNDSQPTAINVNVEPTNDQSNDSVSVSAEGEVHIVEAPAENPEESVPEQSQVENTDVSDNQVTESPSEPVDPAVEQPENIETSPVSTDPGIVPSVQPALSVAPDEVTTLKKRNKSLKIVLVIVVVLLVAIASALVVYFSQQQKAASDLDQKNQEIAELQKQISDQQKTSTQATIDSLNSQLEAEKKKNAELSAEITELNATISSYQVAAEKLLSICGTKCNSVELPVTEQPSDTSSSTNSNQ
jgi:type II secretory pathway pseudopilin PulG